MNTAASSCLVALRMSDQRWLRKGQRPGHLDEAVVRLTGSLATRTPPLEERPGESLRHSANLKCNRRCWVRLNHDWLGQADTQTMPFCDECVKVDDTEYMNCCAKIKKPRGPCVPVAFADDFFWWQDDPITSIGGKDNSTVGYAMLNGPWRLGAAGDHTSPSAPVDHSSRSLTAGPDLHQRLSSSTDRPSPSLGQGSCARDTLFVPASCNCAFPCDVMCRLIHRTRATVPGTTLTQTPGTFPRRAWHLGTVGLTRPAKPVDETPMTASRLTQYSTVARLLHPYVRILHAGHPNETTRVVPL